MASGMTTTDNDMMRAHQERDLRAQRTGTQGQGAVHPGLLRGATIDEVPTVPAGPRERLVQPGTNTPARGLGNIVNGHNRPADHAPAAAVAKPDGAPS